MNDARDLRPATEPIGRAVLEAELAKLGPCSCCGEKVLALFPRCHRRAGVRPFYGDGKLVLRCAQCNVPILVVWVGEGLLQ
jgi:hypothetical protein